ncbi:MAG: serine--tRNA ligase [Candidatus Methylarchaceae archaeon HK02M2]|nr:serine--tRNA ligase [Candidatus Methylarchaceae archaeon HK02M2]
MLDIKFIRENQVMIKEMLNMRAMNVPLDRLIDYDTKRRKIITNTQKLKHERNLVSEKIAKMKKENKDVQKDIEEMKKISDKIANADVKIRELGEKMQDVLMVIPNIPDKTVPYGKDESDNVEIRRWGEFPNFKFRPKDHIDLGLKLDLIDIERAAKVAGSRFYYLKGNLVLLNFALIKFGLDFMRKKGFTIVQTPYMLRRDVVAGCVALSDFKDAIYKVEGENLYLLATSEHSIAGLHKDEILGGKILPLKYAGISPCYRKEAGAHGRDTKGIFRVHQFEKVEQFTFCKPNDSWEIHELLLRNAEEILQLLNIPYRVMNVCIGDLGTVAAKKFDLEAWLPGQRKYREVVSCSNCLEYQARRLNIRYRERPNQKPLFVHTLNSTAIATERTLIAIMENYQEKDCSIRIPKILKPYMNGLDVIAKS